MEIGHKVSFIILVFWCFIIVFVVWLFIVLSSVFYLFILHPFYRLSGQLIIGVTWVNLVGWAGRGQCTDLASWPLHKMSLAVFCSMSILISCCFHALVDQYLMPNFPFILYPSQIVEIFPKERDHRNAIFQSTPNFLCVYHRQSVRI